MGLPSVCAITATAGRMTCLRRSVACFIAQEYDGYHELLIFNNASKPLILHLPSLPSNKRIHLINSCDKNYSSLGEIYMDALQYISTDITVHADDDDLYLPNHLENGCLGLKNHSEYKAYKPKYSYYRGPEGWQKTANNMEPSIFVDTAYLKSVGYHLSTSDQHMKWFMSLKRDKLIFEDEDSAITFIYNWGDGDKIPTWKTSGDPANPRNFTNYRKFSQDFDNGIIIPISQEDLQLYYDELNTISV